MAAVITASQMREIERRGLRSGRMTGLDLMQLAADAVCDEIAGQFGDARTVGRRAVVLCGPGNNGGDGYAVAAGLKADGWTVSVHSLGEPARLPPDAATMFERWSSTESVRSLGAFEADEPGAVHVDALFGTGLGRPIDRMVHGALERAAASGPVVAVDILSGLNSDTGRFMSAGGSLSAGAQLTVTFQCAKAGHHLQDGTVLSGRLVERSIGLEDEFNQVGAEQGACRLIGRRDVELAAPRKTDVLANKYSYGHVLVLSGGRGRGGAARLAARAALRVGAGLVTIGVEDAAISEHASQLNAIMLRAVDGPDDLEKVLSDSRIGCICVGPALGLDRGSRDLVDCVLSSGRRLVLDADSLTMFGDNPDRLFDSISGKAVLTPHGGEFCRLFPDLHDQFAQGTISKVAATASAASRSGAAVLYKGHDTVVASPDGRSFLVPATGEGAAPWLATAGSGDVLAGVISGLAAVADDMSRPAWTAAWLHAAAARKFGPGLIAEDLPDMLPTVLSEILQGLDLIS